MAHAPSTAAPLEKPCSLLLQADKGEPPNISAIRSTLETGSEEEKIETLKKMIGLILNGENLNQLLMTIIRFLMPMRNKQIKKLLLLYLEIIDKTSPDGKLLPEMILVCNALRNDLIHPNEYVRGCTLRFLCRLKEAELLEPLLPTVRNNLEHRHSYVRRNAVLALWTIFKNFDSLCPDAPELAYNLLLTENDASCKRNAFLMLCSVAHEKAVEYLSSILEQLAQQPDVIQIIAIDLIRQIARSSPSEKSRYVRPVISLLSSQSAAVQFEAAAALISLSHAPTAVKEATSTYINLLIHQSDNNVKLIVLDRLTNIKDHHPKIVEQLLMDILRALTTPNMDIRKKTLSIALELVTPRTIEDVITTLKKEISKTQSKEFENGPAYRQHLIQAIHQCAVKFPDVSGSVVVTLMDYLGDTNAASAVEVVSFVREVIESNRKSRSEILQKLIGALPHIRAARVYRAALWILGQYTESASDVDQSFTAIKDAIGEPSLIKSEVVADGTGPAATDNKAHSAPVTPATSSHPPSVKGPATTSTASAAAASRAKLLLPDGSYATQSAYTEMAEIQAKDTSSGGGAEKTLRSLIVAGDYFLASVVASTLTKLVLRAQSFASISQPVKNQLAAEVLLLLTAILRYGNSTQSPNPIDGDSADRLYLCIRILAQPDAASKLKTIFLEDCHTAFEQCLAEKKTKEASVNKEKKPTTDKDIQADDLLRIRQLNRNATPDDDDQDSDLAADLSRATGQSEKGDLGSDRLDRVYQLTGFSDPLYAEAHVTVHQYDIVLDIAVTNQTGDTLQNVALELATLGDLKLLERPQTYTIGPYAKINIHANIKVSSTETGIIFGNLVYDLAQQTAQDKNCVILNDIHIDIMDYMHPGHCSEAEFRTMWADFEWENKVSVSTSITNTSSFLQHIMKSTNMACLTPASLTSDDSAFLSANLYAKSIFGEDALANVSIEKQPDGKLGGFIRIRSKTQGIALSIGDKINLKQKAISA